MDTRLEPSSSRRAVPLLAQILMILLCGLQTAVTAASPEITWYGLRPPGDAQDIEQGSGLCFGSVDRRDGLWIVCDRNGGASAGRIYRIAPNTLSGAIHRKALIADEELVICPPRSGWTAFRAAYASLGPRVLDHLEERITAGVERGHGPKLDLEAVTIGRSPSAPAEDRLFVAAEEPYSLVLELELGPQALTPDRPSTAILAAVYRYAEGPGEQGSDANDGLEALAYSGTPGRFWWAEEGTRLHQAGAHPRLFFSEPRIGSAQLDQGLFKIEERVAEQLTEAVRRQRRGDAQTLNALCLSPQGALLAVDRNGGWVLRICPRTLTATPWFSLYDVAGVNLREALADFPGQRRMPYMSIEGIAVDQAGDIWLVDDPAMPEAFRASCLLRISGMPVPATPHHRDATTSLAP